MKVLKTILLLAMTVATIHAMLAPKKGSAIVALLKGNMSVEGYLEQLKESPKSYPYWLKVMELKTADYAQDPSLYLDLLYDIAESVNFVRKYTRLYRSIENGESAYDDLDGADQQLLDLYYQYVEDYNNPV